MPEEYHDLHGVNVKRAEEIWVALCFNPFLAGWIIAAEMMMAITYPFMLPPRK